MNEKIVNIEDFYWQTQLNCKSIKFCCSFIVSMIIFMHYCVRGKKKTKANTTRKPNKKSNKRAEL